MNLFVLEMQNKLSVFDCSIIDLGKISFDEGNLTVVENTNFPFVINRIFYLYDISGGESRGAHAHKECHQLLVAASGSLMELMSHSFTALDLKYLNEEVFEKTKSIVQPLSLKINNLRNAAFAKSEKK